MFLVYNNALYLIYKVYIFMLSHFLRQMILLFLFIGVVHANEEKLDKIRLQLQWKHQFEFAGFYMAKEKGFYKEVGLDVEFLEFDEDTNIVSNILDENAEYGLGYSSIIVDYLNNKPIVFVANFFKQSPLVLVTQKEITSLSLLKGSKVEGLANNIHNITLYTMLEKFGISSDDIETINPTFSIKNFINKDVDAMSIFTTNELYLLDEAGAKYNIFDPVSYGAKYYDANLFTSKDESLSNPKRVQNMRDASIKGWKYALEHKEETIAVILKKYNSQNKSYESLLFESRQIEQIMLAKVHKIGSIDKTRVEMIADLFKQSGFVENGVWKNLELFIFKSKEEQQTLTHEEKNYLKEKKIITACVDPHWKPFAAIENGKYVGVDADFIEYFEEKLGIPIHIYKTTSWSQSVGFAKAKKCDILSMIVETEKRKKYLNFTDSYFNFSNVIVTQADKNTIVDLEYMKNIKIAIKSEYAEVEIIQSKYPNIEVIEVKNIEEGIQKVQEKEVFGYIDNAFTIDYYLKDIEYPDLKIGNYIHDKSYLKIGVRDDDEKLYHIFQKLIKGISLEEQHLIRSKWLNTVSENKIDYGLIYKIGLILIIIFIFVAYRYYASAIVNRELKRRVEEELEKSKGKDKMIFHQSKLVAMGEMIENIAHQWRQPLSQVNSCVLVIDDKLDEKGISDTVIEQKLMEIESLTKYMSNTIEDFKNFFDQSKLKSKFIIEDIIDKSLEVLSGRISQHSIKISRGLATAHTCEGYPNELQQAFISIINNAIDVIVAKEIQNGNITIDVNLVGHMNTIVISDNGGGISQELMDKIFEPYHTSKHKSQGTGLGLYIAKIIIEDSLEGELSVKNNFNGASFTIKLRDNIERRV